MYLPDINSWLALAFDADSRHPSAKSWFDSLVGQICFFCRYTQQGFLRHANNPKVYPDDVLTPPAAWQAFETMMTDSRIAFANEPADLETRWRKLTPVSGNAANSWNDAYLAAFAIAHRCEVVTYDNDFSKYPGLNSVVLPTAKPS